MVVITYYCTPCRLTDDQKEVLEVVERGHNVFITGQAGSGKSFLVKDIFCSLVRRGIRCAIICPSGIGGTVYDELGVKVGTVHAYYGFQTADLPWTLVVEQVTSHNLVRERIKGVKCIVWDDASMSSRRIFELVNYVHPWQQKARLWNPLVVNNLFGGRICPASASARLLWWRKTDVWISSVTINFATPLWTIQRYAPLSCWKAFFSISERDLPRCLFRRECRLC